MVISFKSGRFPDVIFSDATMCGHEKIVNSAGITIGSGKQIFLIVDRGPAQGVRPSNIHC